MGQWIKVLAAKSDDTCTIPGKQGERTDSYKLSYNFPKCMSTQHQMFKK